MTKGIKRAIQTIKVINATYQHGDVLIVLERGENALKLIKLIDAAFDGKFIYETITLDKFVGSGEPSGFICSECIEHERVFKTLRGLKAHFSRKHIGIDFPEVPLAVTTRVSFEDKLEKLKKYLEDTPKKVLILQRDDDSSFIEGQKDIRPLKYLDEDDEL